MTEAGQEFKPRITRTMGKEADFLEAARTGNIESLRNYVRKIKASTSRPKSAQKKRTIFQSHQAHSFKSSVPTSRGSGVNCRDWNGETPLHLATLNNHVSVVLFLVNNGAQVNLLDNQGCLPLHLAAWTGNADICRILVEPLNINEVNTQNKSGDTSLHIAAQYGHTGVARLLLQNEANSMIRNVRGESTLDLASFYGRLETVSLLINEQPALLQQMQHSHSPLHLAARNGQKDVVRKLIQAGYNINCSTMNGSALHEAVMYGKVEVMKVLLQSGIDKTIKNRNELTVEAFLESQNSSVANSLLLIVRGQENLYHCLSSESGSDAAGEVKMSTSKSSSHYEKSREKRTTPRIRLCKHGKPCKDASMVVSSSHQRRDRERSLSGQTSGSASPPPQEFVRSTAARSSNTSRGDNLRRSDRSYTSCSRHQHHVPGVSSGSSATSSSQHHQSHTKHNHISSEYRHHQGHQYAHQDSKLSNVADVSARSRKCHSCQHHSSSSAKQISSRQTVDHHQHPHHQPTGSRRSSDTHHHHHVPTQYSSSQGMMSPPHNTRNRSCSTPNAGAPLYMSLTESAPANHHDYMIQLPLDNTEEEESNCDNYLKLSDTTSPEPLLPAANRSNNNSDESHIYQVTSPSPDPDKDHVYVPVPKNIYSSGPDQEPVYDKLPKRHGSGSSRSSRSRNQSGDTVEDEDTDSPYDKVPVPCPVRGLDQELGMYFGSPPLLSPPQGILNNSSMNGSFQSQDSLYNSPDSLSPELSGRRKPLGHIYVNLTNFRSTPDLNSIITQGPKKPPRTPTTPTLNEQISGSSGALRKSSDYVAVSFQSGFNSRSTEILNSRGNGYAPALSQSFQERLILSVPPQSENTGPHFIFPPAVISPGLDIEEDDPYENMAAIIHQQKATQPPKALPRKPKSLSTDLDDMSEDSSTLEAGDKMSDNNNTLDNQDEASDQVATLRTKSTGANRRTVLGGGRQSARLSVRVLDGIILDIQEPITGKLLLEKRLPTFEEGPGDDMSSLADDSYDDWKQIDGIFASMGVDGELSEESFLNFLKKDKTEFGTVGSWLTNIGLGQYENVLIINGYDNINMLNGGVLEESDLIAMGFTNAEHISAMVSAIQSLPQVTPIDSSSAPASVQQWLSSLDLDSQYLDKFYSMEFTTMARVQQIWEVELASVLGVLLLGHQKRILVSLGNDRPGFDNMWRKSGSRITDISQVVKVGDVKIDGEEDIYFKHDFTGLQSKYQKKLSGRDSPAKVSLERSDSGCSISSGGAGNGAPAVPDRNYRSDKLNHNTDLHNTNGSPPALPTKKRGGSLKNPSPPTAASRSYMNATGHNTMASFGRSQSVKHITKTAGRAGMGGASGATPGMGVSSGGYLTMDSRHSGQRPKSNRNSSGSLQSTPLSQVTETFGMASTMADYANLTEQGVPLIGNVEGLKLSKAQARSKRILNKVKRALPDLPPGQALTFTVADLPPDFKGKHKPEILIDGCVNYSACYLGTCLVKDITGPESTRGAIAKMKMATESVSKLPVVVLSISFKGVDFIDSASKRPICEHEITNIYCAAQDSIFMNYFAYITKDILTKGLYCHVFCVKSEDMARDIILTLGEAFDIAFYAVKKHPCLLDPDR